VDSASHTLKTPLTRIGLLAENVQQGWVTDESQKKEFFGAIISETRRMNDMIDNMLNFSKIESGRKRYEPETTSLPQLVGAFIDEYSPYIENLGFAWEAEIDDSVPPLPLDREAVKAILVNLLQNALKYSLEDKYIGIRLSRHENRAVLEFEDRGMGIPAEDLDRVFKKFFRVQDLRVKTLEGSGLGLYLAQHAVEAHGGEIKVRSQPGAGSTFTVSLPIAAGGRAQE
jgi:signal transduction histidine kinase